MLRKALGEKVKGVFYGSSINVEDPVTGEWEKKPLKPFLVNQTTLLLERGQLRIPHKDTSDIIRRQMTNFQVVKISERTQEPTYSNTDEHGLDAMIFALYAFIEEYPDLINTIDKRKLATKAYMTETKSVDPLSSMMKERIQKRTGNNNDLTSHSTRASLKTGRRKEQGSLGWGRRGLSTRGRPHRRKGF